MFDFIKSEFSCSKKIRI